MRAYDVQIGDVFASRSSMWSWPEMYVVYEVSILDEVVIIRYLYIGGEDAGVTYCTMLKRDAVWGDTRMF